MDFRRHQNRCQRVRHKNLIALTFLYEEIVWSHVRCRQVYFSSGSLFSLFPFPIPIQIATCCYTHSLIGLSNIICHLSNNPRIMFKHTQDSFCVAFFHQPASNVMRVYMRVCRAAAGASCECLFIQREQMKNIIMIIVKYLIMAVGLAELCWQTARKQTQNHIIYSEKYNHIAFYLYSFSGNKAVTCYEYNSVYAKKK